MARKSHADGSQPGLVVLTPVYDNYPAEPIVPWESCVGGIYPRLRSIETQWLPDNSQRPEPPRRDVVGSLQIARQE